VGYLPETVKLTSEEDEGDLRRAIRDAVSAREPNVVLDGLDQARLFRVVWKVVRGLAIGCIGCYVPESRNHTIEISVSSKDTRDMEDGWLFFHGDDAGAFSFRYGVAMQGRSFWELTFWSRIWTWVTFTNS
jgi:hypothetical protein